MSPQTPAAGPLVRLAEGLHLLPTDPSNVYIWIGQDGVTLIDSGLPGAETMIADALRALGFGPSDVNRLVLTHWHTDHSGAAAAVAAWGAQVCAGRADAQVIRGMVAGSPPMLTPAERPHFEQISRGQPPAPPCPVHRELNGGDSLDVAGEAVVIATPGHTPGALAIHFPGLRVVLTGDTASSAGGRVALGPFNNDPAAAGRALRELARLDVAVAGFGHGDPVLIDGRAALAEAAASAA